MLAPIADIGAYEAGATPRCPANCDVSSGGAGTRGILDDLCFQNAFASGCA